PATVACMAASMGTGESLALNVLVFCATEYGVKAKSTAPTMSARHLSAANERILVLVSAEAIAWFSTHLRSRATQQPLLTGDFDRETGGIVEGPCTFQRAGLGVDAASFQFRLCPGLIVVLDGQRKLVAIRLAVSTGRTQYERVFAKAQRAVVRLVR